MMKLFYKIFGVKKEKCNARGFTIAELLISVSILALIITFASTVYINFYGSIQNLKAANLVYEEARFVMERIAKEIRNGTIDYEEYYNQTTFCAGNTNCDTTNNETYGKDYCSYSAQFYNAGPDGEIGTLDDESTGMLNVAAYDAIANPIQSNLFLININGDRRSYIKRVERTDGDNTIGRVGLIRMQGGDFGIDNISSTAGTSTNCTPDPGENDGRIDTWSCEEGFNCPNEEILGNDGCTGTQHTIIAYDSSSADSYVDITPEALDIVDLKFIIAPKNDPRKAFNDDSIQVQPHITIKLVARANPKIASEFESGRVPSITLTSTISARAQNEIITECNLKQCIPGNRKACSYRTGVAGPLDPSAECKPNETTPILDGCPALQECTDGFLWGGCDYDTYLAYAESEWGDDYNTHYGGAINRPGDGKVYQSGSEFASCTDDICKVDFCTDGFDNDANGSTDGDDPNCRFFVCNNGTDENPLEVCLDVGGICEQIRPFEEGKEINCYDGYDNDCDGNADEFDSDCILQLCTNGEHDPKTDDDNHKFLDIQSYSATNYLWGANPGDYVDTYDEKCGGGDGIDIGGICDLCADGDGNICNDCADAGCNPIVEERSEQATESPLFCTDGYDNDCDGLADEFDSDCQEVICTNGIHDCDIAYSDYEPKNYLVDYNDSSCDFVNDEQCKDIGGICDGYRVVIGGKHVDHTSISNENAPSGGTDPDHTCQDGLDNDCDTFIDWLDEDCCPDEDGDGFLGKSASNHCFVPAGEDVDCGEGDASIYPGAPEDCTSPSVDQDCDGKPDSADPDCCVDTDGDNYGVADAYLSCSGGLPDCDDTDSNISPGANESDELCMNEDGGFPINDNCKISAEFEDPENPGNMITSERANHIDWYRNETGGIARAYDYKLFEPNCCTETFDICEDNTYGVSNSDENCNGLEGFDDEYCVYKDGDGNKVGLYDNFNTASYLILSPPETTDLIVHNADDGYITLTTSADTEIVSSQTLSSILDLALCTTYSVSIENVNYDTPGSTNIKFQLSKDAGTTWCGDDNCTGDWIDIAELPALLNFDNPALRWRAELDGDGSNMPKLNSLVINILCTP